MSNETDAGKMGTALNGIQNGKYNAQEAIAYMKMAEKCPEEILYDKKDMWDEAGKDKKRVKKLEIKHGIY